MIKKIFLLFAIAAAFCSLGLAQNDQDKDKNKSKPSKLTAEEVVAKHLASIGTPEILAASKTRFYAGEAARQDATTTAANQPKLVPAQFASDGKQVMMAMMFDEAPESLAFNGKEQTLDFPKNSSLGEYFKVKKELTANGFLGGALSTAWPLLDLKASKIDLDYVGISEAGGKQFYHLRYRPVGHFTVSLFFDAQNFRHVTTEYIYHGDGSGNMTPGGKGDVHKLVEVFSDFKKAGNLVLPTRYTLKRSDDDFNVSLRITPSMYGGVPAEMDSNVKVASGKTILSYTMLIKQIFFNEVLEQTIFTIAKKP